MLGAVRKCWNPSKKDPARPMSGRVLGRASSGEENGNAKSLK